MFNQKIKKTAPKKKKKTASKKKKNTPKKKKKTASKKKKKTTPQKETVESFLKEKTGWNLKRLFYEYDAIPLMLKHNKSLSYWKSIFKKYGDLGGTMTRNGKDMYITGIEPNELCQCKKWVALLLNGGQIIKHV